MWGSPYTSNCLHQQKNMWWESQHLQLFTSTEKHVVGVPTPPTVYRKTCGGSPNTSNCLQKNMWWESQHLQLFTSTERHVVGVPTPPTVYRKTCGGSPNTSNCLQKNMWWESQHLQLFTEKHVVGVPTPPTVCRKNMWWESQHLQLFTERHVVGVPTPPTVYRETRGGSPNTSNCLQRDTWWESQHLQLFTERHVVGVPTPPTVYRKTCGGSPNTSNCLQRDTWWESQHLQLFTEKHVGVPTAPTVYRKTCGGSPNISNRLQKNMWWESQHLQLFTEKHVVGVPTPPTVYRKTCGGSPNTSNCLQKNMWWESQHLQLFTPTEKHVVGVPTPPTVYRKTCGGSPNTSNCLQKNMWWESQHLQLFTPTEKHVVGVPTPPTVYRKTCGGSPNTSNCFHQQTDTWWEPHSQYCGFTTVSITTPNVSINRQTRGGSPTPVLWVHNCQTDTWWEPHPNTVGSQLSNRHVVGAPLQYCGFTTVKQTGGGSPTPALWVHNCQTDTWWEPHPNTVGSQLSNRHLVGAPLQHCGFTTVKQTRGGSPTPALWVHNCQTDTWWEPHSSTVGSQLSNRHVVGAPSQHCGFTTWWEPHSSTVGSQTRGGSPTPVLWVHNCQTDTWWEPHSSTVGSQLSNRHVVGAPLQHCGFTTVKQTRGGSPTPALWVHNCQTDTWWEPHSSTVGSQLSNRHMVAAPLQHCGFTTVKQTQTNCGSTSTAIPSNFPPPGPLMQFCGFKSPPLPPPPPTPNCLTLKSRAPGPAVCRLHCYGHDGADQKSSSHSPHTLRLLFSSLTTPADTKQDLPTSLQDQAGAS